MLSHIATYFTSKSIIDIIWISVGFLGQVLFSMRFALQWIKSEMSGSSVIPMAFWYFSILGSIVLLLYSIHIKDIVYICAQLFGIIVYSRNLFLIKKSNQRSQNMIDEKAVVSG